MFPTCNIRLSALTAACCCSFILLSQFLLSPLLQAADPVIKTEKIIYSISDGATIPSGTIYSMDPDGSNKTKLFDFSKQPKDKTGFIRNLQVNSEGNKIFFDSDNTYQYGPSRFNLFNISQSGQYTKQLTPSENSGTWGTGSGTVTGTVYHAPGTPFWGIPLSNAPVNLEGYGMMNADSNGKFTFTNVRAGQFWLVANGVNSYLDSTFVTVQAGLTTTVPDLQPQSTTRWSYKEPVHYQDRVYYIHSQGEGTDIKYTDTKGTLPHTDVLKANLSHYGGFNAFDVGQKTGKLLIHEFRSGCGQPDCGGVFTADKDGKNMQQIVFNMIGWANETVLGSEIFWNPDETLFAMKYNIQNGWDTYDYIGIFNANGQFISELGAGDPQLNLFLNGWSPDGAWILFSGYTNDIKQSGLAKVKVSASGDIDTTTETDLLSGVHLISATWGALSPAQNNFNWNLFLPAVIYSTQ